MRILCKVNDDNLIFNIKHSRIEFGTTGMRACAMCQTGRPIRGEGSEFRDNGRRASLFWGERSREVSVMGDGHWEKSVVSIS